MREWKTTEARDALAIVIDAAVEGEPQLIHRPDGKEVVVVSREDFEARQPNLRDYLLTAGYAEDHDAFNDAPAKVREGRQGGAPRVIRLRRAGSVIQCVSASARV